MQNKKAISPIIGAILLVVLVVVMGSIVFLWGRGFLNEARGPSKFGEPVERACERIKFEAGIFQENQEYVIEINNQGDVEIYGFKLLIYGQGKVDVLEILDENILAGESRTLSQKIDVNSEDEITLVPLILAETSSGADIAFDCSEQYSEKVIAN